MWRRTSTQSTETSGALRRAMLSELLAIGPPSRTPFPDMFCICELKSSFSPSGYGYIIEMFISQNWKNRKHLDQIDPINQRIIRTLQKRGNLSSQELAETVGSSAASCWRRVKALEKAGVLGAAVRPKTRERPGCILPNPIERPGSRHARCV